ncbi:hybrid sensor histidine kinase/response regulator [Sneathiella glossodoripedis]|uniref:hybrid sensor histidine kinase/response regulator n=1 Tax=Sneathiella glossodoripedis TaxID=418853 RepID=UPI000472E5AC|nr:PAS domain S-box protein [Sneathiella glossodoripedis]
MRDFYVDQDHRRHLLSKIEREGYLRGDTLNIKTLKNVEKTVILSANMITYKGNPSYFVSLMDITDMITAQTALQQSEQQYRALNELIPDALVLQIDGKVALVNESAISTFRVNSISDLVGLSSINLVAPDERPRLQEFRKKVLKSGKPEQIQTRYQRMDGDIFHVEMHSQAMIWNGRQGTLNFIRDVTARHIYERELLRREREMALAQTIGRFGHWRVDLQKQEVYWSKELFNIYMRPISEKPISPKEAATLIFPDDLPKVQEDYFDLIKTGQSKILPLRVIRSDGAIRHVETSMQPELDSKGVVQSIFGVTQDITERKELEERLRQSQKMEAVGQLTGGVAHDFNNLLAVIQGNAELLQEMLDPQDEKLKARTEVILEAAERGADLTKSMLAFGRTQALNPATINLNDNVAKMLKVLDRTIEKNIHICLDTDPALWDCFADPGQVENAILNLTINSRDAMPNGGQLTLKTNNVTLAGDELKKADNQPEGDYVRLSVTDTGQGIDSEKLEHVFEPFFTTKEVGKGTGLGLSMVYGFIKQSNGHIDIQSVVGEGTSVDIYLPKHTLN